MFSRFRECNVHLRSMLYRCQPPAISPDAKSGFWEGLSQGSCASTTVFLRQLNAVQAPRRPHTGCTCISRSPKDHMNIRIRQAMVASILLVLGLGPRMQYPYVYVVFAVPNQPLFPAIRGPFFVEVLIMRRGP